MSDLVSVMLGWCCVPIPSSLDIKDIEYILAHAEVTCMITSKSLLPKLRSVIDSLPKLKLVVQMDIMTSEEYQTVVSDFSISRQMLHSPTRMKSSSNSSSSSSSERNTLMIVDFEDLATIGREHMMTEPNLPKVEDEIIATIVYTSGSTGRPKGAVNTYARWNAFISYIYNMPMPLVRLSFMPLAHNTERQQSQLTMCYGGKMCFSRGEMSKIFEEFALVNPTSLSAAPRFYDSIYSQYQATLAQFRKDYSEVILFQAEEYCLEQYRGILGNAMQVLVVGGAAVSSFTKIFMERCFKITVFDGYGTTEAGGITAGGKLYPGTEVKIVDCPDLGYTSQDKPWPRGEVWAKTLSMVSGYYKDQETTNEYFKDGWFITGDIVEVRNGDDYVIIDRRKNLFKLSQGVFVAPSAIENKLLVSDYVHQIYVYGDHTRSNLVCVIVPNLELLAIWCVDNNYIDIEEWCKQNSIILSEEQDPLPNKIVLFLLNHHFDLFAKYLCCHSISIAKVHREIINTAQIIDLPSYHIPSSVTLEHEKWTPENRLVTPSDKPQRAALEKKYGDSLKRMYQEVETAQNETALVTDQVRDIVGDVMANNGDSQSISQENLATNLATDSLSVLKLIHTLNKKFKTNLSFMDVMAETGGRLTPELIAEVVQRRSTTSKSPSVRLLDPWSLHDRRILADFDIVVPVDDNMVVEFYAHLEQTRKPKKILITGATGFLGFHLLCELLSQYVDAQFVVLVRAENEDMARLRVLETTAIQQRHEFSESETLRMEFICGDLSQPRFGLDEALFNQLAQDIDSIYHVGAIVNWVWGYATMRDTNVLGTIELLKLATTHRLKYFYFVSTISTSNGIAVVPAQPSNPFLVDWQGRGPLEETSTLRRDEAVHRSAYVISKWVAETIVKRSIQLGLPGCIMRPGMITGHSETGACHSTDFCPRLLIGLSQSGIAFNSTLPLEWMPVDFCAKAIVGLGRHFVDSILPTLSESLALGVVPSFNLQNFNMATYKQIIAYLNSAGLSVNLVGYQEWRSNVASDPASPLWALLPFFGEETCTMYAQLLPAPQTHAILTSMGIHCPPADEQLFHTYVKYLEEERLI
jgi:fatty acid CoA ligase FadD9